MGKMKQRATSLLTIVFVMLISSCNLFIDEDFRELPSDEKSITHTGDGYNEPTTVTGKDYYLTYQYQPNTRVLSENTQQFITNVKSDILDLTYIINFDEKTPEDLLPRKGEIITCPESENFPYGIAAEVVSAGYMNGAYILFAIKTSLDKVYKVLKGHLDLNFAEELEQFLANQDVSNDKRKVKQEENDDDESEGITQTEETLFSWKLPVEFSLVRNVDDSWEEYYGENNVNVGYEEGAKAYIKSNKTESYLSGKTTISLDFDIDKHEFQITNFFDVDVTFHVKGEIHKKAILLKKMDLLYKKKTIKGITFCFSLGVVLSCDFNLGLEGVLRYEGSGDMRFKTTQEAWESDYQVWKQLKAIGEFEKSTRFTENRLSFTTQFVSETELRCTLKLNVGILNKFSGLRVDPYARATLTSTVPKVLSGRYDLTRNHAIKNVLTFGVDIKGGFDIDYLELIKLYTKTQLTVYYVSAEIAHEIQSAINEAVKLYILNFYPEEWKDDLDVTTGLWLIEKLEEGTERMAYIFNETRKILDGKFGKGEEKPNQRMTYYFNIFSFDGEKHGLAIVDKYYWYPRMDDKDIYVKRGRINEGKKQEFEVNLSLSKIGILADKEEKNFYPNLDIYKVKNGGEERAGFAEGYNSRNELAVIKKGFNDWIYFKNISLDEGETYKAYVCYSDQPGHEPKYYDKPITIVTELPNVVISDVRDLHTETMNEKMTIYNFTVYLTVKGAKQFDELYLKLYDDTEYNKYERRIKKIKDVTDLPITFEIRRFNDKPFKCYIEPNAHLKDKKSGGVSTSGSYVKYKRVAILMDYWGDGEPIQILNE